MSQFPFRITQRDVARALGLSQATVSMALANNPRIPEGRRLEIQAKAKALNYRPDPDATNMAHLMRCSRMRTTQGTIAWLNFWEKPRQMRRFQEFDRYWQGALAEAEKFGYQLEEFHLEPMVDAKRLSQILRARNVCGVLAPPCPLIRAPAWSNFDWTHFSIVRFGLSMVGLNVNTVLADGVGNEVLAFREMRKAGYRRIGHVFSEDSSGRPGAGFLWAQSFLSKEEIVPRLELPCGKANRRREALLAWVEKESPDAIFTSERELPAMLTKEGFKIPEDIALAATTVWDCPISAGICGRPEEIGRVAVLELISLMRSHSCGIPPFHREILVPGVWTAGDSLPIRNGPNLKLSATDLTC